ncbi:hypothetical protein ACGFYY_32645 [Streptomyces sp. NPDC048331]|uniref:hypothetical protein n=1 Tax=Streptomyces sp. NPDC048331 TaxID=3365534 RepID=UPI00371A5162
MDPLTVLVIAYLVGRGLAGGTKNVKDSHENTKEKLSPKKNGDKAGVGTNVAAGVITAGTALYTFGSGFKNGWKDAYPEARDVVKAQREKNRLAREARENGGAIPPPANGQPPLTPADGAGVVRPDGTIGPAAPPGTADPNNGGLIPPPPAHPPTNGPASAGPSSYTPGSSTVTTPGAVEVRNVDTLVIWLEGTLAFANRERDDAVAAVKRIADLEAKVEATYNQAVAAKYDNQVLGKLAALRDQLGRLKAAREADASNSAEAAANSSVTGQNVLARHGGINEAAAAAPEEMAESTTYID